MKKVENINICTKNIIQTENDNGVFFYFTTTYK